MSCITIKKYIDQVQAINNTWGKLCKNDIKLLFLLGEDKNEEFTSEEYIYLQNVKNDYLSVSYKQFLGLKYVYENYKTDFLICFGSDTYLNIPKLMLYINQFNSNDNLYIGGHGDDRKIPEKLYYFHSGGPGFIITYNCLKELYPLLYNLVDDWIQFCKINNIEYLSTSCDVAINYYLQEKITDLNIIKTNDFSIINCNHKGYPCHIGQVNFENIISCHNMTIEDFDDFTNILVKNNYFINN